MSAPAPHPRRAWLRRIQDLLRPRRAVDIPDALWLQTLADYPFLKYRSLDDLQRLRALTLAFLDRKEFQVVGGLALTDAMAVAIAAQACVPILHLGLDAYDSFVGIVVQPDEVRVRREWMDEAGVVHEEDQDLAGEAVPGGPVMLSWVDVQQAGDALETGYNVVIHEFIHVLDAANGALDGAPRLPDRATHAHWRQIMDAAWRRHVRAVEQDRETLIDPYGTQAIEEFFAVAAECFFTQGRALKTDEPALYDAFATHFKQDTARYC